MSFISLGVKIFLKEFFLGFDFSVLLGGKKRIKVLIEIFNS